MLSLAFSFMRVNLFYKHIFSLSGVLCILFFLMKEMQIIAPRKKFIRLKTMNFFFSTALENSYLFYIYIYLFIENKQKNLQTHKFNVFHIPECFLC